jgi:23S rRNA G2069 N7-methylase RlmK/C1962 C5-methylase RlmI
MYEPTQNEINNKVQELLAEYIQTSWLNEALVDCGDEFRAFYKDSDLSFELKEAIDKYIIRYAKLEEKAEAMLIAERGVTVRTDVDDYKFVPHDTRY